MIKLKFFEEKLIKQQVLHLENDKTVYEGVDLSKRL